MLAFIQAELPEGLGQSIGQSEFCIHGASQGMVSRVRTASMFSLHHICSIVSLFFKRFYLFIYSWETQTERERERGRDKGRGRSRLLAGSLMRDSIPDPGITTWAEGRCPTAEPPRHPQTCIIWKAFSQYLARFKGTNPASQLLKYTLQKNSCTRTPEYSLQHFLLFSKYLFIWER